MDAIKISKIEDVRCRRSGRTLTGVLHLTAHHLILDYGIATEEEMWIPYPLISLVTRMPIALDGSSPLSLHLRDFRSFTLNFKKDVEASDAFESVKGLTVVSSVSQLYAFYYTPNAPFSTSNGWSVYSPREEFSRMGIGSRTKAWRFTDVNKDYSFCPTYPGTLVVPSRISDATLQYASKYRSKCRIPALAYLHWGNQATITRSSQPMVGLTNSRSIQDEKLIEAIFQSHFLPESRGVAGPVYGATATNLIIDARPTTNAMANVAKGAGTENMDYYKEGKKAYLGIDNIHVMRDSLNKVVEAIREADAMAFTIGGDSDSGSTLSSSLLDRLALRRSGWLRHISAILDGTLLIVRNIHINSSHVLIHCSDGWDRTGQLSSLSQLCLDPFYRTVKGFQILIEKDWLSFGHRFLDRCGHLSSEKFFISATELPPSGGAEAAQALFASMQNRLTGHGHLKETSPVFHQFLECVRQIQRQYPERFEFNGRYLERIYYHLYSCQFGTFLFNCEKERRTGTTLPPPCERTHSIWDHLNLIEELEKNKNTSFDPSLDNLERRESKTDMGILYPDPKNVRFWNELYGRTDEEMNGKVPAVEAQGADSVGPIEGKRDDPVTASTAPEVPSVPSASSPQSVLLPEAESRSPSSSRIRPGSPRNSKARIVSSSVPELPRRNSARGLIDATGMSASEVVTPKTNAEETPAISAHARLSPHLRPAPPQSDVLHERMRSVWGKFSSNASAAFTVVQGAYDGVTKELKGMAINQGWDSEETSADELRHQRRPHVPEGEGDWTSMVPSSTERSTPASSWAPDTVSPPDRWRTQSSSSKFSMLTLENPWGTTQPQREPSSPRRVDEIFSTTSVWSENDHHSPKPLSPSVAATERHAHSEGSDPLGVL